MSFWGWAGLKWEMILCAKDGLRGCGKMADLIEERLKCVVELGIIRKVANTRARREDTQKKNGLEL